MAVSKDHLNQLIQQLPDDLLPQAAEYLERLVSNTTHRLIPWDDEPTTQQDLDDIKKAKKALARGETIRLEDVIDELLN